MTTTFFITNRAAAAAAILLILAFCAAFVQGIPAIRATLALCRAPAVLVVIYTAFNAFLFPVLWLKGPRRAFVACLLPAQFLEIPGTTLGATTIGPFLRLVRSRLTRHARGGVVVHVRTNRARNALFLGICNKKQKIKIAITLKDSSFGITIYKVSPVAFFASDPVRIRDHPFWALDAFWLTVLWLVGQVVTRLTLSSPNCFIKVSRTTRKACSCSLFWLECPSTF